MTKPPEPVVTGEFKPCPNPWCESHKYGQEGAPTREDILWLSGTESRIVGCAYCNLQGPIGKGEAEAITAWNTRQSSIASLTGDVETAGTLDDLANKPVGGDFSLRAFNVVRCLANAEFRSEIDRCKDEAEYLMASLKEPGLPKYLRIGFPELEALHYLSTTPSAEREQFDESSS